MARELEEKERTSPKFTRSMNTLIENALRYEYTTLIFKKNVKKKN